MACIADFCVKIEYKKKQGMANIMKIINFGSLNIDKSLQCGRVCSARRNHYGNGIQCQCRRKRTEPVSGSCPCGRAGTACGELLAVTDFFLKEIACRCWCGCFLSAGHGYRKRLCFY